MKKTDRRSFIKTSVLGAASLSALPIFGRVQTTAGSANGDIRVAIIGLNGRGKDHIKEISALKGVRIAALCDADSDVLAAAKQGLEAKGASVEAYGDIRKLLENKDIDAITIAMPNHWHSLAGIWAIQAGKDVYVEKPISHNVWEGRQLVNAARKYNRIVQAGTQCRSNPGLIEGIAWVQEGNLGKILRARGLCYKRRESIGKTVGPQPVPKSVDYDLWCGPSPNEPLRRKKLHYDWHWVWPSGNGDLGNQGIHQVDIARWALGEPGLSPRVFSFGGRFGYEDDGTTPNTLVTFHEYPKAPLIFEVRGLPAAPSAPRKMDNIKGAEIGVVVDCEHGCLVIPSYTDSTAYDSDGKKLKEFHGGASHFQNFFDAMHSRKPSDLKGEVLLGHISSALCHTGNISYQIGSKQSPDAMREKLKGNADALESLGRMLDHLGKNDVALDKTPATFGEFLKFNPETERFDGNAQANGMLGATYRAPFVVPTLG